MNTGEELSWVFAGTSNIIWLFVILPQLYKNYKLKSSKSISFFLVFCWIVGEMLSMLSAWGKGLSSVIIFTAAYHLIFNLVFIAELLYYRKKEITKIIEQSDNIQLIPKTIIENRLRFCNLKEKEILIVFFSFLLILILLFGMTLSFTDFTNMIGWLSTVMFIVSKIPQIILNRKLKDLKGLSKITFVFVILSSLFFLFSILIRLLFIDNSKHSFYILNNLQWIVGTLLSCFMDVIILGQMMYYNQNNENSIVL